MLVDVLKVVQKLNRREILKFCELRLLKKFDLHKYYVLTMMIIYLNERSPLLITMMINWA